MSGIFLVYILEDFAGDFLEDFLGTFSHKARRINPATKSAENSGGSNTKIREKSKNTTDKIRSGKVP